MTSTWRRLDAYSLAVERTPGRKHFYMSWEYFSLEWRDFVFLPRPGWVSSTNVSGEEEKNEENLKEVEFFRWVLNVEMLHRIAPHTSAMNSGSRQLLHLNGSQEM